MVKPKKADSLKKAVATNRAKAADAKRKRESDVDRIWGIYAKALLGESITPAEEAELPGILESLGIQPERVNGDLADVERVIRYRNIIAQEPPQIDALRARAKSLLEQYEVCRRQLKTAGSYEVRRRDMTMRIDAIKHACPPLWKRLDGLLPPVEPGTEPQPRGHSRILALCSPRRASSPPVDAGDGDPEPLALVESVVAEPEPVPDPALAAAVAAGIEPPAAETQPMWPRPIKRRFDGVHK